MSDQMLGGVLAISQPSPQREGVSARDAGPPPPCDCHSEPMVWLKRSDLLRGGYWYCRAKSRESHVRSRARHRRTYDAYMTQWRAENRRMLKSYALTWRYGISVDEYDALAERQGGRCAICKTTPTDADKGVLHVDHDHKTGAVRGLLCMRCNTAIKRVEDCQDWLDNARRYLSA